MQGGMMAQEQEAQAGLQAQAGEQEKHLAAQNHDQDLQKIVLQNLTKK
jgi:hypothetical protein